MNTFNGKQRVENAQRAYSRQLVSLLESATEQYDFNQARRLWKELPENEQLAKEQAEKIYQAAAQTLITKVVEAFRTGDLDKGRRLLEHSPADSSVQSRATMLSSLLPETADVRDLIPYNAKEVSRQSFELRDGEWPVLVVVWSGGSMWERSSLFQFDRDKMTWTLSASIGDIGMSAKGFAAELIPGKKQLIWTNNCGCTSNTGYASVYDPTDSGKLMQIFSKGIWGTIEIRTDGSYLVFDSVSATVRFKWDGGKFAEETIPKEVLVKAPAGAREIIYTMERNPSRVVVKPNSVTVKVGETFGFTRDGNFFNEQFGVNDGYELVRRQSDGSYLALAPGRAVIRVWPKSVYPDGADVVIDIRGD